MYFAFLKDYLSIYHLYFNNPNAQVSKEIIWTKN